MHLLATTPGTISDGAEAVDLGQTPGEIVFLSAADSELACLAQALPKVPGVTLRLANLMRLQHPMSVDVYTDAVLRHAKLIAVRLLGGRGYWSYGVEQIEAIGRERDIPVVFLPGDDQPDADLASRSTVAPAAAHRLWQYLVHGGAANAEQFLRHAATLIGKDDDWREPAPLPPAGLYPPGRSLNDLRAQWIEGQPLAALTVYRASVQAGDTAVVEALLVALERRGLNVLPVFVASLKDPVAAATLAELLAAHPPDIALTTTAFAVAAPGRAMETPFAAADCPVLQVILAGTSEQQWRDSAAGLGPRDIAMNMALPEVDGRIITRAVGFKAAARRGAATECDIVTMQPVADRVDFVADLAANWTKLRRKPVAERRIALIMANYPNRDGRIGNGVGLDTPASVVDALHALAKAGYRAGDLPADGAALMSMLLAGPTNALAGRGAKLVRESILLTDYTAFFNALPQELRDAVNARWGAAEDDPHFVPGELHCGDFFLAALRFGNLVVAVQPARGYNIDPSSSYHDPALVPPHHYLAFHAWLRDQFRADAVVQMGKHGNLEWLPGKGAALSASCFPEAALGPLPHLYPFIVNDPGEGTQAKRRAQAVVIDHLTPPLTRAGSHGPLVQLERLVDEYYDAATLDPRRIKVLTDELVALLRSTGLDQDCGIAANEAIPSALKKLDNHLCELKELQIRDGLHIFGRSPSGGELAELVVAIARAPRGSAPDQASLLRALADDLALGFDPLDCVMGDAWMGARPDVLENPHPNPSPQGGGASLSNPLPSTGRGLGWGAEHNGGWRTYGDTVERLEALALSFVDGAHIPDPAWTRTAAVLAWIERSLRPAIESSGAAETNALLRGLDGRFIPPGPSGAPSRGRPEVLPTGRNFYSVDTRALPTPAAWHLGWKSAALLLDRHRQDHGEWPRAIALSAWGTSAMRTGGDDIAQALALIGVRPRWDESSRRVVGFEILPASILDRPRVDVTLRVSGFFRDAFPVLIDLFDSAVRAVAALDEPDAQNPLAARVRADRDALVAAGADPRDANRRAGFRVFGSKPGAYGAGLQALIDEKGWETADDLARAYLAWGGYAYGDGAQGTAEQDLFAARLTGVQAVIQNQDNREHDLLDSDDYYQFEGGMAATVKSLSGQAPVVYHGDHALPERPRIRTLAEEIARVVRGRAANPKWIAGVMRHGYKGAFEMAATVDYLFAFAATTNAVKDHHFDAVFDAYLGDDQVRRFIAEANPAALAEMEDRFDEAIARGLWHPRRNDLNERLRSSQ
ncbi:MAG TPA: cobaltochelatase subunit CobN [Magnetospirillaceae bacterium]|jgi:cobaltochelatase CobN